MIRVSTFAVMLLLSAPNAQTREPSLLQKCQELFAEPTFDCACAVKHLEPEYSAVDTEILLTAWALSRNAERAQSADIERFQARYSAAKILQVLERFHFIRMDLFTVCPGTRSQGHES